MKIKTKNERDTVSTITWNDRIPLWGLLITAFTLLAICMTGCGGGGGGATSATVAVQISPASTTLAPSGSKTFTATVSGATDTTVTWACDAGTIDQAGDYFAPK